MGLSKNKGWKDCCLYQQWSKSIPNQETPSSYNHKHIFFIHMKWLHLVALSCSLQKRQKSAKSCSLQEFLALHFHFYLYGKMWRKKVAVQNSNAQERQSYFSQNICRVYFSYPMPTVCIAWNKHVSCNAQKIQKNATHKRWTHISWIYSPNISRHITMQIR